MTFKEIQCGQLFIHKKFGMLRKYQNNKKRIYFPDMNLIFVGKSARSALPNKFYLIKDETVVEPVI